MQIEVKRHPTYTHTIARLEALKRISSAGIDYWMAREIFQVLGYPVWDKFVPVIERAATALQSNGLDQSHHIAQASKMMGLGMGAQREGVDYFLSRPACRLIAMNGDPSKPEIAGAQAYFLVQAQRMEQQDSETDDEKRLELRKKVTTAFRAVSGVAKEAGVSSRMQPIFHDARSQGLYGMSGRDVKRKKGLRDSDNPFDFAGPLELSANEFQMNMSANAIKNERVSGEQNAIRKNRKIAEDVRSIMKQNGATMPEDLPIAEPIREVQKRLKHSKKLLPKV